MKRNKSTIILATAILGVVSATVAHQASAITYQDSTKVEFTFNPTINVSLSSSDLTISDLAPGSTSDSNVITATVSTNAGYGYYLSATAGTAGGNTNLTNTADSTYNFASLSSNAATLSAIPDNKWGYSYSTDNGNTWISGDNGSALAGYNGLPLDADDSGATGVKLLASDSFAGTGSVQFKIGARASSDQAAGTYTGTVNFYAVTNPKTIAELQNLSSSECTATESEAIDSRDGTLYRIQRLADGKCWLLDNLALDLTSDTILNSLSDENTNIDISNDPNALAALKGVTIRDPSTDPNGKYATAKVSNWVSDFSYSAPLANLTNKEIIPSDTTSTAGEYKVGAYYNYCAASAGSYCYGDGTSEGVSSGNATSDICPKGWRMPTGSSSGEFSSLANSIYGSTGPTGDATAVANYRNALHLPLSGGFSNGSASSQGTYGYWWSSTRYDDNYMHILLGYISNIVPTHNSYRGYGASVRCVLGS